MTKSQAGVPLVAITGAWDLGSFLQNTHSSVARLELVGGVPDECFFDEVVSGLRGTSDMTEVHRHIFSDEALWNFQVYLAQKEDRRTTPVRTYRTTGTVALSRPSKTSAMAVSRQSKTSATAD